MNAKESSWHSYPSVFSLGHSAIQELLNDDVLVEEKVDGSQFSFGRFGGELRARSKGKQLVLDSPEEMFVPAINAIATLDLRDGWTYRGEFLGKPKHNTLAYGRIPEKHIIIFDINTSEEEYLPYGDKLDEATRIGLEVVPIMYYGKIGSGLMVSRFLDMESCLGGTRVEGVVIKNYCRFGKDKKVLMGKYVSEAFKEKHAGEWRRNNPNTADVISDIILSLKTEARWNKAIQHLSELGELDCSPKDIGALMKEVKRDIVKEEREYISDKLYKYAIDKVLRGCVGGFPEWYKERLMESQFDA